MTRGSPARLTKLNFYCDKKRRANYLARWIFTVYNHLTIFVGVALAGVVDGCTTPAGHVKRKRYNTQSVREQIGLYYYLLKNI